MEKTSVGFIISTLNRAGAEGKLVAVANGLDSDKFKAHVFVLKSGPLTESLNVPFVDNVIPSKYSFTGFLRLIKLIRKAKLDIVWIVGTGDAGFFGRIAAKLAGVSIVIMSLHATGRPNGKPTVDKLNRILNHSRILTDRFVAVGDSHRKYLIEKEGLDASRTVVIHNGVNTDEFSPEAIRLARSESWGIPSNVPVIGIFARFKLEKRHDIFLYACKELLAKYPKLRILLVGDGPLEEDVKRKVVELDLDDYVHFTGGLDDVRPALARMTVSVICSDIVETFSNTMLESMASGVPFISTRVGSAHEAIEDGFNGFLIEKNDPEVLAVAIDRLLDDSSLRVSFSKAARQTVLEKFSLKQMIRSREILFEELSREESSRR